MSAELKQAFIHWPSEMIELLGKAAEKCEVIHAKGNLRENKYPVVLSLLHCAVVEAKRCGVVKEDLQTLLNTHPYWLKEGVPDGWDYHNSDPVHIIEKIEVTKGDDEPQIIMADQVIEAIEEDKDLAEAMKKFSTDMKNSMQAVKDGRYKSMEEAMKVLGYELDELSDEEFEDEVNRFEGKKEK